MIWKNRSLAPALRIMVEKVTCLALHFPKNSKYIVSGWSDDCVRIFSPKNGKLIHRIADCNLGKVTELISDEDSTQYECIHAGSYAEGRMGSSVSGTWSNRGYSASS